MARETRLTSFPRPANVTYGGANYYFSGNYSPAAANDLIANTTITALYSLNKTLVITGGSDTVTYDGEEHEILTATLSDPTLTVTGYTVSGKGTNAGGYDTIVTLGDVVIKSGGVVVTNQYDVSTKNGKLTINPATLTVAANEETLTYPQNRTAAEELGYAVMGGLVGTQEAGFTGTLAYKSGFAVQPLPGIYGDAIEKGTLALETNGTFLAGNYALNFVKGKVTVASGTFSVSLTDTSAVYNGLAHSATLNGTQSGDGIQYFVKAGSEWLPTGSTPSVTNVSDGPKDIKVTVSRVGYTSADAYATLTITPAPLTVTAKNKEITYPAARPLESTLDYTVSGNVSGETPAFSGGLAYKGSLDTNPAAGSYLKVIEQGTLQMTDGSTFKASNYSLSFVNGDLTVKKGEMVPGSAGYTGVYDGHDHGLTASVPGVTTATILYSTSEDGTFTAVPPTFTDAGTYTVYFKAEDTNYNPSGVYSADVVITAAPLTVTAKNKEITYPAARPLESALDYTVSGNVSGETPAFSGGLAYKGSLDTNPAAGSYPEVIEQGTLQMTDGSTFKASNYSLSFVNGDLTVKKGEMVPGSAGYTGVYDGHDHGLTASVPGVTTATILYSTSEDGTFTAVPPTFTDAGTYTVYFKAEDTNYNPSGVYSADVVITAAPLTVTAKNKEITYPAARPLESTLDYTVSGNVSGETPAFSGGLAYKGSLDTNPAAGSYLKVIEQGTLQMTDGSTFKASNYSLSFVNGDLTVKKGEMVPGSAGYTGVYDGHDHGLTASVPGVTTATILYSTSEDGTFTAVPPTFTDAGTYTVYFKAEDTNYNPSGVYSADVVITAAPLTVTAKNKEITYPAARPLESTLDYTVSGNVSGETPAFSGGLAYKGSLDTNPAAGSYTEVIEQGTLQMTDGSTFKASNYSLSFVNGDLTVKKGEMVPGSAGYTGVYDGHDHGLTASVPGVTTATILYSTSEDGTFTAVPPTFTDAGTYTVYFKAEDTNYNPSGVYSADVVITAAPLTVTAKNKEITYPAARPLESTLDYTVSGNVSGETPAFSGGLAYKGSLDTNPAAGSYPEVIEQGTLQMTDGSTFKASNYSLSFVNGDLTVKKGEMVPGSAGYTGVYDGHDHGLTASVPGVTTATILYSTSEDGTFTAVPPTFTDAGTYTVYFKAEDTNYNPSGVYSADVVITAAPLTVTAKNKEITYPAARPLESTLDYTVSGNVSGETPAFSGGLAYKGSLDTNPAAGSYPEVIEQGTLQMTDGSTFKASNYSLSFVNGDLTVKKGEMVPGSAGYTGVYDGHDHGLTASVPGVTTATILYSTSEDGTFTAVPPTFTDAGTYTVYFKAEDTNYNPSGVYSADVVITQAPLTVTAKNKEITYPAARPLESTLDYTVSGNVSGETPAFSGGLAYKGSLDTNPAAGSYPEVIEQGTLQMTDGSTFKASNYSLSFVNGDLTVKQGTTLTVGATNVTEMYNGGTHMVTPSANVTDGTTYWYSLTNSTNPANYSTTAPSLVNVADSGTVYLMAKNPNYENAFGEATVTITKRTVDLTSGSANRIYNGEALSSPDVGIGGDDFAPMEGFATPPHSSVSITNVGSVTNTFDIPALLGTTNAANYTFVKHEGTLRVDKAVLTVTPTTQTMTYGDTTFPAETVGYTGFVHSEGASVVSGTVGYGYSKGADTVTRSNTLPAGSYTITPNVTGLIAANYSFASANGTLTVEQAAMEVTSEGYNEPYDGLAHGLTASVTGLTGMEITYSDSETGSFGAASPTYTNAGTYTVYFKAHDLAGNYADDTGSAQIIITKVQLTATADPQAMTYGDTALPTESVTYTGFVHSEDASVVSGTVGYGYSKGAATVTRDGSLPAGSYTITPNVTGLTATNYSFAPANGTLTVNKAVLTVTAEDKGRVYGSTALPDESAKIEGFVNSENAASAGVTGGVTYSYYKGADEVSVNGSLPAGSYVIVPDVNGLNAANYTFSPANGTLTVAPRSILIAATPADKDFGTIDPAFTYTIPTGNIGGTTYYNILPSEESAFTITVYSTDLIGTVGVHTGALTSTVIVNPSVAGNYAVTKQNADLTVNPRVTYDVNTVDLVTGFPPTAWFDYLGNATLADAVGVTRLGYTLAGWLDADTGTPIALGQTITGINRNYKLTAVWALNPYTITYVANGVYAVANMPANRAGVLYTTPTAVSGAVPTQQGYTFLHWTTADITPADTVYAPGDGFVMPSNNVVLTAAWTPDITPVYYHANGGNGGTVEEGRYATLSVVTVAGNMFTRPGFRFLGWSAGQTGAATTQPGDTFAMGWAQVNFYAQWEQEFYTVTYMVSGGTGAGLDGAAPYAEYTNLAYGGAMPQPTNPALEGYTFQGWTTAIPATVPVGGLTIYGTMTQNEEPPIVVPDEPVPLAGPSWALVNLILAIATALASVLMLIGLIGKKKREELEGAVVRETKKHPVMRWLTLVPTVGGIVAFLLTENMKNPMAWIDRWTILMGAIALAQLVFVIFGLKKDKDVDPEKAE